MTHLETERLRLRPFRETDLDDLCAQYADPEVMRFLANGVPLNRDETAERLRKVLDHWQQHGVGIFAVCDKSDGRYLGRCGFGRLHDFPDWELAYAFCRDAWGRGYCTEAARAVVRYAFDELHLPRLIACARPENFASIAVMLKLGMTFERMTHFNGGPAVLYALANHSRTCSASVPGIGSGDDAGCV
jgi:ribosomal-protein-alanine N-acetyltransferase